MPEFDLFDGIFDNQTTQCREVWQDGRMRRFAHRRAVGYSNAPWREMHKPWGSYPDLPANAREPARVSA
jgi:hypothetical protein